MITLIIIVAKVVITIVTTITTTTTTTIMRTKAAFQSIESRVESRRVWERDARGEDTGIFCTYAMRRMRMGMIVL